MSLLDKGKCCKVSVLLCSRCYHNRPRRRKRKEINRSLWSSPLQLFYFLMFRNVISLQRQNDPNNRMIKCLEKRTSQILQNTMGNEPMIFLFGKGCQLPTSRNQDILEHCRDTAWPWRFAAVSPLFISVVEMCPFQPWLALYDIRPTHVISRYFK